MFVHTRPGKCDARLQVKRLLKVTYQGAARIRHRGVYSNWLSRRQHRTEAESGVYDCLIAHFSIYFVFHAYFSTSVNQHSRKFKAVVWRGFSPNKKPVISISLTNNEGEEKKSKSILPLFLMTDFVASLNLYVVRITRWLFRGKWSIACQMEWFDALTAVTVIGTAKQIIHPSISPVSKLKRW